MYTYTIFIYLLLNRHRERLPEPHTCSQRQPNFTAHSKYRMHRNDMLCFIPVRLDERVSHMLFSGF